MLSNLAVSANSSESETESSIESSKSSSASEQSYADITRILMAQPEDTELAQSSRTDPFFEVPVLRELATRFTGSLRD